MSRELNTTDIQSKTSEISQTIVDAATVAKKRTRRHWFRSKKRLVRNWLISVNILLLVTVFGIILSVNSSTPQNAQTLSNVADQEIANPLDKLSSADIAVNIAQLTRMDQVTAVVNNADTLNSQIDIVAADSQVIAKPSIVSTEAKSISDLREYVVVSGDTVTSIAQKFNVTKDTIRWSNNLYGETVAIGTTLQIPPVDGLVYKVEEGDTVDELAETYSSNADDIIAFNDAELTGLVVGQQIVIPDGEIVRRTATYSSQYSSFRFGTSAIYGYNGYDFGYCTYYAANRRAEVGKPVPANLGNASTWKVLAQKAGIPVGNTPQKHAVIWTPPRDYYGHVGFVEEVYPDGSVLVSEMNVQGWNVRSQKVLTPAQAAGYSYIY